MSVVNRAYAWACERLYHELAPAYELVAWGVSGGRWGAWRRLALDYVQADEQVLELGFGTGKLLATLRDHGLRAVGIELSPAMHVQAMRTLARPAPVHAADVPRVRGTALQLPFADGSFDVVASTFPAPYVLAPETLAECARVLRPGGRLVIVGLWMRLDPINLPLLYGALSPTLMQLIESRLGAAGLNPQLHERADGAVHVGVVVGEQG